MKKAFLFLFLLYAPQRLFSQTDFTKIFSLALFSEAHSITQTSDSGFIVCGTARDSSSAYFSKIFLLKLTRDGDSVWSKQFGGFNQPKIIGVCQFNSGDYLIGFDTHLSGIDYYLNFLLVDDNGDSLLAIPPDSTFSGGKLKMAKSENIYIAGSKGWYDNYGSFNSIALIRKYNKQLNKTWESYVYPDGIGSSYANNVIPDDDENLLIGGGISQGPQKPIIQESDSSGNTSWYLTYSQAVLLECFGSGATVGKANNGILFSVSTYPPQKKLLINLDTTHNLLWKEEMPIYPEFFHQWNDKTITLVDNNFRFLNVKEDGEAGGVNENYTLETSVSYDAIACMDESMIVAGTNCAGCSNHREVYIVKVSPSVVGIDDDYSTIFKDAGIRLFPIPADSKLSVEVPSPIESITFFSVSGNVSKMFNNLQGSIFELDISDLANGMYLVSAFSNDNIYRGKLLVER